MITEMQWLEFALKFRKSGSGFYNYVGFKGRGLGCGHSSKKAQGAEGRTAFSLGWVNLLLSLGEFRNWMIRGP